MVVKQTVKTQFGDYPGYDQSVAFPFEASKLDENGFDELLLHCSDIGASDIDLMTNEPVVVELEGQRVRVTKRIYGSSDIEQVTNIVYGGANGVSHVRAGNDIDNGYSIRREKEGKYFQYRVNITGCRGGIHITIRTIKGVPLSLKELNIEKGIVDALKPENGLIFICGKTGSGKSTLIAASIRDKLDGHFNKSKILIFESPIEYVYDSIPRGTDMVVQHEIPKNLPSFAAAVRNSLRRAPSDIVIGECRDYPTISAAIEAAETGHLLSTTIHANSVSESFYRILNMFPEAERSSKLFEVMEVTRLIVAQKLVRGVSGKRVALREYLVFDQYVRDRLRNVQSLKEAVSVVAELVRDKGQTMISSAFKAYQANLIDKHVYESIEDSGRNIVDDFKTEF